MIVRLSRQGWTPYPDWVVIAFARSASPSSAQQWPLDYARQMAAHERTRTTKLYDRRNDALDQVERWSCSRTLWRPDRDTMAG
jgi:hypothetical protein